GGQNWLRKAPLIHVARPETADVGACEQRQRVRTNWAGAGQVQEHAPPARPKHSGARAIAPGDHDHHQEDEVGIRPPDGEARRPSYLEQRRAEKRREPEQPHHEDVKSVITSTTLRLVGSFTQARTASSSVDASLWFTEATCATTRPRG